MYVDVDDRDARRILVADNRTSDLASYDDFALADLLKQLAEEDGLPGTGYDGSDLDDLLADLDRQRNGDGEDEGAYTPKIESPLYEPRGDRPDVSALTDTTRRDALRESIAAADVSEELRAFLQLAAERHTRFDYEQIAEFYAHAEPAVKRLMEESALVIIDFGQAVERGFVQLNDDLDAAFRRDYPDA